MPFHGLNGADGIKPVNVELSKKIASSGWTDVGLFGLRGDVPLPRLRGPGAIVMQLGAVGEEMEDVG